jgi:hypothetical protein
MADSSIGNPGSGKRNGSDSDVALPVEEVHSVISPELVIVMADTKVTNYCFVNNNWKWVKRCLISEVQELN